MITLVRGTDGAPALLATTPGRPPLRDVGLHPLVPGDAGPLLEVFAGMSPDSRFLRFLSPLPELGPAMLRRLTDVDHEWHGCWFATLRGEPVAVGRYVRDPDAPAVADLGFEVVDQWQGHGLGRLLLGVVASAAAAVGVDTVSASMAAGNTRVRRLAAPLGGRSSLARGVVEGTAPVPVLPPLEAARVARCAEFARRRARTDAAA